MCNDGAMFRGNRGKCGVICSGSGWFGLVRAGSGWFGLVRPGLCTVSTRSRVICVLRSCCRRRIL